MSLSPTEQVNVSLLCQNYVNISRGLRQVVELHHSNESGYLLLDADILNLNESIRI